MSRGFFEIGIVRGKTPVNVGTLWRSAYQLGAAGIFTIGARYPKQASDTLQSWRHVPLREHLDFDAFHAAIPFSAPVVAIETSGRPLSKFLHPERAIYLLGAEDHGIPRAVLERCHYCVSLEAVRTPSFNVAVAGSLVMYHRMLQLGRHERVERARDAKAAAEVAP